MLINAQDWNRTSTDRSTRPSNVRVYQFRHLGNFNLKEDYLFESVLAVELLCCSVVVFAGSTTVAFTPEFAELELAAVDAGFVSVVSPLVCNTETFPVIAEKESSKAANIKVIAAAIVILDKTD